MPSRGAGHVAAAALGRLDLAFAAGALGHLNGGAVGQF